MPNQEDVIAELLQNRPDLHAKLDCLATSKPYKCPAQKTQRLPPLPAFPRKRFRANQEQCSDLKRPKHTHPVPSVIDHGCAVTSQHSSLPTGGHSAGYPVSRQAPMGHNFHGTSGSVPHELHPLPPPHLPTSFRPDSCSFPLWGHANVVEKGRLLGTVQLTPHGWVGPTEAVQKVSGLPANIQPKSMANMHPYASAEPPWHHPWHQPPPRIGPLAPQGVQLASNYAGKQGVHPLLQAAFPPNWQTGDGGAQSPPQQSPQTETGQQQSVLWNQEDINLASQSDTDSAMSEGSGRRSPFTPPSTGRVTVAADPRSKAQTNPLSHSPAGRNIDADVNGIFQSLASKGDSTGVLVLGTGCAEPSKYRASSGILLHLNNGRNILLDAGEGTCGQMIRYFGAANAQKQVDSLAVVFVSHRHADHSTGVPGVLRARSKGSSPLLVVCPHSCASWLKESYPDLYTQHCILHFLELAFPSPEAEQWLRDHLGIIELRPFSVRHCADAWGLKIMHKDGWSVCYSGDTRPCKSLVDAARGCTLLIHEATYSSEQANMAMQKKHSTVEEAVSVADQAQVEFCLLTHFSQRYGKLPCRPSKKNIVAFDGLKLTLSQLPHVEDTYAALAEAFSEVESAQGEAMEAQQEAESKRKSQAVVHESNAKEGERRLIPQHIRFDD